MTSARANLPVDGARLWADLMALAAITEPDRPHTRRSFTPMFLKGREWLAARLREAGLTVRMDTGGNLFGRLEGREPEAGTILIGSHSDTVPSGGRFDGTAGVLAALEIVRSLKEGGVRLRHAVEVVDFLAEEPSEYGLSCIGSRVMAGLMTPEMLDYREPGGERLGEAMNRVGADAARLEQARRTDIAAFLELHIEQGIVLESQGIDLGIVTAIAGIARAEIRFSGRADHAGATPMHLRRDAGLAAARLVALVNDEARRNAGAGRGHFVATVGVLEQHPNAANVIAGEARLVVDIRAEDHALAQDFLAMLEARSRALAADCAVERSGWTVLSNTTPAACDPWLRSLLAQGAGALGFSCTDLASGAGHDAAFVARFAPAAMLFVPCREGRSHCPEEWAEPDAIAAGAATIFEAVLRFDRGA
jgi:N-carbamoyl-L-amino-acid hydrolase